MKHRIHRKPLPALAGGLALLLTLGTSALALAGPGGHKGHGDGGGRIERVCERLECTDRQKSELKEIFAELRTDIAPDREAIRETRGKLVAEFAKDRPDEAALARLFAKIDTHHKNMRERTREALMEAHGVLTSAQRQRFAEVASHMSLGGPGHGGGGHHGGPDGVEGAPPSKGPKGDKGKPSKPAKPDKAR